MRSITFTCFTKLQGKARPRFANGRCYTPSKTAQYEAMIGAKCVEANGLKPLDGPIKLTLRAIIEMPKSWSKKKKADLNGRLHCQKPDSDNCIKAICDGLNNIAFTDDQQVAAIEMEKRWGEHSRFTVILEEVA